MRGAMTLVIVSLLMGCDFPEDDHVNTCIVMREEAGDRLCVGRDHIFDLVSDTSDVDQWMVALSGVGQVEVKRDEGRVTYHYSSDTVGDVNIIVFGSPEYGRKQVCRRRFVLQQCLD